MNLLKSPLILKILILEPERPLIDMALHVIHHFQVVALEEPSGVGEVVELGLLGGVQLLKLLNYHR